MGLGNRIKELRENTGYSRQDLADRLGISYYTVSKYETEERKPDIDTLVKIASIFSVSLDYLLGRTDLPEAFTPDTFAAKVAPELEGYSELPEEAKKTLKDVLAFLYNKYGIKKEEE